MAIKKSELYSSLWQSCDELRGGMDASQYKDYVLVLLFVKYVSDKAASQKGYDIEVPKGGRFADMVALKGDKENLASEMTDAGYTEAEAASIRSEVTFFESLRNQVKLHSGDAIDLKQYEPAMRHLIDTYIRAEESEKVSAFDDLSLVQLIVERGAEALNALPEPIRKKPKAAAETIENNVRKLIIDESPINPKYYERMSHLLDALIEQRKQDALSYQEYLEKIVELTRQAKSGPKVGGIQRHWTARPSGHSATIWATTRRLP